LDTHSLVAGLAHANAAHLAMDRLDAHGYALTELHVDE
jgi:hypothetical protein